MRRQHLRQSPVGLDATVKRALTRYRVAHLATADLRGRPHVVPICFVVKRMTLYSVIDRKPKRVPALRLRRLRNLAENPHVAVVVDRYSDDWTQLNWVLVQGTARLLESGPEHTAALRSLRAKYPQYRPMDLGNRPVIAVDIKRASRWGRLGIATAEKKPAGRRQG